MDKRNLSDEERRLAERLKREAELSRPAFSEALHQRICAAVRQEEPLAPRQDDRDLFRRRARWPYLLVAASVLVAAGAVAWSTRHAWQPGPNAPEIAAPPRPARDPLADVHALVGVTRRAPQQVGTTVESTLSDRRWAYLDHDARLAADMLIDQLPLDMLAMARKP